MATNRRDAALEDARTDESDLFADITASIVEVPTMPDYLKKFDQTISNVQGRSEGRQVFLVWLKAQLEGVRRPELTNVNPPCSKLDLAQCFFPELPYASEYDDGASSPEFLRLLAIADIDRALAKRECASCPFQVTCLTQNLDEKYGVYGGWDYNARRSIKAQFDKLRKAYLLGLEEDAAEVPIAERRGMTPAQIADVQIAANAALHTN